MAENPLVHLPAAWPVLTRANALLRAVEGRLLSLDLIQWDGVPCGDDIAQRLHIWEMNDLCPRDGWPAVLLLHGGGWVEGDWRDYEGLGPALARRGLYVAALDYRLAPDHRWPAQRDDVLAALSFLRHQQVDPTRIALWGHSAGGQMALLAAAQAPVRCLVATGTPTDLRRYAVEGPDRLDLVFDDPDLDDASPLTVADRLPPTLLLHGALDRMVSVEHARRLHEAAPDSTTLWELPDGDHGLRWPPVAALQLRRRAIDWVVEQLDLPKRGSKWKVGRKRRER